MVVNENSYEYYAKRCPYKKILQEEIGLEVYFYNGFCQTYSFSYDMNKLVANIKRMKERLMNTKIAKCVEAEREELELLPDSIYDFENAFEINRVMGSLITYHCIPNSEHSRRFEWDVKNHLKHNFDFNMACAKKMKQPLCRFTEYNGWENEFWQFYFEYPTEEEYKLLEKLSDRVKRLGKINQRIGYTHFEMSFVPQEYNKINWDSKATSYMRRNNYVEGKIDFDKMLEIIEYSDDKLFDFLYKGGIRLLVDAE